MVFFLNKIEVYSFSGLAVPFYFFTTEDGVPYVSGGMRIGKLTAMNDPLFESKCSYFFLATAFNNEFLHANHLPQYVRAHKKVSEETFEKSKVLVDAYGDGERVQFLELGGSYVLYNRAADGKISMRFDGEMLEEMDSVISKGNANN